MLATNLSVGLFARGNPRDQRTFPTPEIRKLALTSRSQFRPFALIICTTRTLIEISRIVPTNRSYSSTIEIELTLNHRHLIVTRADSRCTYMKFGHLMKTIKFAKKRLFSGNNFDKEKRQRARLGRGWCDATNKVPTRRASTVTAERRSHGGRGLAQWLRPRRR